MDGFKESEVMSLHRGPGEGEGERVHAETERETDSSVKEELRCAAAPKAHTGSDMSRIYFLDLTD